MKEEIYSKEKEIKAIRALKEMDGYFTLQYTAEDVDKMCENIKNDIPLAVGTSLDKKIGDLEEQIDELHRTMIRAHETGDFRPLYDTVVKGFGMTKVIKFKRNAGYALSENEIDFLIENVKT